MSIPSGRRQFVKQVVAGAAFSPMAPAQPAGLPNIVYIHSHDTGRYVQPYGHNVPTPNLQRFAGQGVLFRQAFDAAPTCSPSRACLLTGEYSHQNGMMGLAHRGFALNDYQRHIIHRLHPAGYHSALCGVQHIAKKPAVIGYREIIPARNNRAEAVAPAAVEWLRNAPRRPFFLDVGFFETHREFHPPGPHENARYTLPPAPIPDTPRSRQDMAAFHASARVLDDAIGAVFSALDASGLAENTLVICTTDHGIPFPGMKCNLTDHGTGVMLMLRGPGGFTGGKVVDAMVSHLDLYPTICDLAGVDHPSWLQGKSLLPLIRGEQQELHEQLFAEVTYHAAYEPKRAVRTKRWKYIRNFGDRRNPVLPNCDDGLSKDVWLESGWKQRIVDREQLYDLTFDPNETRNMAGDASSAAVLEDMRARLNRWMVETHDPLLKGPVPLPAGAVANDPAGTSPKEI